MPTRILVAVDNSEPAREALSRAIELFPDAECTVVTVVNASAVPYIPNTAADRSSSDSNSRSVPDTEPEDGNESQDLLGVGATRLADAERIAADHGVEIEIHARVGPPAQEIVDYAAKGAFDHIVMGNHGRSGVSRLVRGSVAEVVVRHSPVPVTVVR